MVLVAVALLLAGWLGARVWQVRVHLLAARQSLATLRPGDLAAAPATGASVAREVRAARSAADDPLVVLAAHVPVLGRSLGVVRDAAATADALVRDVLPTALQLSAELQDKRLYAGGQVSLPTVRALGPQLATMAAGVARAADRATATPGAALPGPVARVRGQLVDQTRRLEDVLGTARRAVRLLPPMLGAAGPRRYFLAVQNNAESRGTGGLVGAYAVLRVDHGRLSQERVGTDRDFRTAKAPVVNLGPEYSRRYDGDLGRSYWSSAGLTPDWPSAAAVMAGLWQAQGGGHLDGVLGVDPLVLSALLGATGPVTVEGRTVSSRTVADFVMRDEYAQFAGRDDLRKKVLAELAGGIFAKVLAGGPSPRALVGALATAGATGHLQVWSAHPAEQADLAPLRAAGALTPAPGAYLQVVMNNASGNKVDYYLRRHVGYRRTTPGRARVTVELTNTVQPAAVPAIVTGRQSRPAGPVEPGASELGVSVFVGVGDTVDRLVVDGRPASADLGTERGHGVGTVIVEVAPSRPTVITADVSDPGGVLTYRQQPLAVDDTLDLRPPHRRG